MAAHYEAPPVAADLTLAEAGRIRRAAKIAEAELPRLIVESYTAGLNAREIARELTVAESYTYRILREWVLYEWRLDLYDSEAGPGWQPWVSGSDVVERKRVSTDALAQRVIQEAGQGPEQHRARVLIWAGAASSDDQALYTTEHTPN